MTDSQLLRCEVARMFGGWPHELLALPVSEYRMLVNYLLAVRARDKSPEDYPE